jgi:large subunit ribosomal protein L31e
MSNTEENVTRLYTINLGKAWITPQYRRTDRVINIVKDFAKRHMKTDDIKIDQDLNSQIWSRGKTNPPRKVRVKMVKDEDETVIVSLYEVTKEAESAAASREAPNNKETIGANKPELKNSLLICGSEGSTEPTGSVLCRSKVLARIIIFRSVSHFPFLSNHPLYY